MTSEWHKSTSDVMPETVDTTSSKFYVLVRRNIEFVNGMYEYEEKFVDRADWEVYQDILTVDTNAIKGITTNSANIDYVAMMSDIEIPTEE